MLTMHISTAAVICCVVNCFVLLIAHSSPKCQPQTFHRPYTFTITNPNKNYLYVSTLQAGMGLCASTCVQESKCLSVLFNSKRQSCVLLRSLLNPSTVKSDSTEHGWIYLIRNSDTSKAR
jgi:hypothetical protein